MRQRSMRIQYRCAVTLLLIVVGCSKGDHNSDRRSKMTEREKDSVLSESGLPGAKVVGRALNASDSEMHHTILLDSAGQ